MLGEPLKSILFMGSVMICFALSVWRARSLARQADIKEGESRPIFLFFHQGLKHVKHSKKDVYMTYGAFAAWVVGMLTFCLG